MEALKRATKDTSAGELLKQEKVPKDKSPREVTRKKRHKSPAEGGPISRLPTKQPDKQLTDMSNLEASETDGSWTKVDVTSQAPKLLDSKSPEALDADVLQKGSDAGQRR